MSMIMPDAHRLVTTVRYRAMDALTRTIGRPCMFNEFKHEPFLTYDYPQQHRGIVPASEHARLRSEGLTDRAVRFLGRRWSHRPAPLHSAKYAG
jgi:hypothetical protein